MSAEMSTPTGKCSCTAEPVNGRMVFRLNPECPWVVRAQQIQYKEDSL